MNDIEITNEAELKASIDALGELNAEIERSRKRSSLMKARIEIYASANKIKRYAGDKFKLVMKKCSAALRMKPGFTESDVVALMLKKETLKPYVEKTYASEALKRDFAATDDGLALLDEVGLMMTEPKPHVLITEI